MSTTPWILQGRAPFPLQYPHNVVAVKQDPPNWVHAISGSFSEEYWKAVVKELETLEEMDDWEVINQIDDMNVINSI